MLHLLRDSCWRPPNGNKTIWNVYGCMLHFNFLSLWWLEVGQDYKAHLWPQRHNTKTLKPFSQGCRIGSLVLYLESIKRRSDHPSRRRRKLRIINGEGKPELLNREETAFWTASNTESCGTMEWGVASNLCMMAGPVWQQQLGEQVEGIWLQSRAGWRWDLGHVTSLFWIAGSSSVRWGGHRGPAEILTQLWHPDSPSQ